MSNRKVLRRKVFQIKFETLSPLSIASGDDEWTDADILRSWDGSPFVPGSSIAGAMRSYLKKDKNENCLMGYSSENDLGKMSSVYVSDAQFEDNVSFGIRDGVSLNLNKTAITGSKYDMEILEHGIRGVFYMEVVDRENDDVNEVSKEDDLKKIFNGFEMGEIRLGQKKTRGFGEIRLESIKCREFNHDNYLDYSKAYDPKCWDTLENEKLKWCNPTTDEQEKIHIEVPLKLRGGISIRQYAAIKGQPDFAHITDNGVPIIPGSSMAGAIRHRVHDLLGQINQLVKEIDDNKSIEIEQKIDSMFGYVGNEKAHKSSIVINETKILGANQLTMTRTGVSRFESAVKQGALYKELTFVNGTLTLKMSVDQDGDSNWILGLIILALKDLQNGYLAVGGETAIGRGVFEENGPMLIDGEIGQENEYITDLLANITSSEGGRA